MSIRSTIKDHKYSLGIIKTPFNHSFGDSLNFSSWTYERFPEYIWIALIHNFYGRLNSFDIVLTILNELKNEGISFDRPKFSLILRETYKRKRIIFRVFTRYIDKEVLSPLCIIFRNEEYPIFNDFFYIQHEELEYKIQKLEEVFKKYSDSHSYDTTDVRYIVVQNLFMTGKIQLNEGLTQTEESLKNYHLCSHDDDRMMKYRPSIRLMEQMDMEDPNNNYIKYVTKELFRISRCEPMYLKFEEKQINEKLVDDLKDALEYVVAQDNTNIDNDKYEVLIGSTYYVLKIYKEIVENRLSYTIVGREAIRTILEVYIMMKYLSLKGLQSPDIWQVYKQYGIGKYKYVLKKQQLKEIKVSHILIPMIEILVNEDKSEEFVDIDLTYFDKMTIKDKFKEVNELDLYEIWYEYDTNFSHGLWGAVRESAMIFCKNPLHLNHIVPDFELQSNLPSVEEDSVIIIFKLLGILNQELHLPSWFIKEYKDLFDE